jgi:hypothetical protein
VRAKLEFELPEDKIEFLHAYNGSLAYSVLQQIDTYLKGKVKHEELSEEVSELCEEIRKMIYWELDPFEE